MSAQPPRFSRRTGALSRLGARPVGWVLFAGSIIYFVVPVCWLFIAATKSSGDLYTTPGFSFADWNLWKNLGDLFSYQSGIFLRWLANSAVYSIVGSVATTLVSAACGYALAIYRFRGRNVIMAALVASLLIPATVLAQPIYLLLVQIGLNNTMWGVILPSMVYPFGVMLGYITAQSSIPIEIIEAARIDGAGEARIFFTIALRLIQTGLTTILLFAFISSWNSYLLPLLVLNDASLYPVTVGLIGWNEQSISVAQLGTLTIVGSLVCVLPVVIIFVSMQRYWRSGLTAGGVKM